MPLYLRYFNSLKLPLVTELFMILWVGQPVELLRTYYKIDIMSVSEPEIHK
ncbi:MAG: hypothetical protein AAGU23_03065 [Bacillota bacterium]